MYQETGGEVSRICVGLVSGKSRLAIGETLAFGHMEDRRWWVPTVASRRVVSSRKASLMSSNPSVPQPPLKPIIGNLTEL